MKFAATILALALATTHGLLDEGDHNVQKKDASKGLRGSAVERAAVGRKLDFYHGYCPEGTDRIPDPRVCSYCSKENDPDSVFEPVQDCRFYAAISDCEDAVGGYSSCELFDNDQLPSPPSPIEGCDRETCRCCNGALPFTDGDGLTACQFFEFACSNDPSIDCTDLPVTETCGEGNTCDRVTEGPCAEIIEPTTPPSPSPTTCPKKLDVCIALDESGSICSSTPGQPKLCQEGKCSQLDGIVIDGILTCNGPDDDDECDYGMTGNITTARCGKFNGPSENQTKGFTTSFIKQLKDKLGEDNLQVSVVAYGTQGILNTALTTPQNAILSVKGIPYSGGFTNLEQAIVRCEKQLEGSPAPVMVVIGDGVPNKSGNPATGDEAAAKTAAAEEAAAAKYVGIDIATVHLDSVYLDGAGAKYFEKFIATGGKASEGGLAFDPLDPPTAKELANALEERAQCSN